MGTTPNLGLPYPENTDLVTNGAQAMQDMAEAIDARPAVVPVTPAAGWTGTSYLRKAGHWVEFDFSLTNATGSTSAAGAVCATLPAGYRPGIGVYTIGVDSASGAPGPAVRVETNGVVAHVLSRPNGAGTVGTFCFRADS